jgi:hypothetical protein
MPDLFGGSLPPQKRDTQKTQTKPDNGKPKLDSSAIKLSDFKPPVQKDKPKEIPIEQKVEQKEEWLWKGEKPTDDFFKVPSLKEKYLASISFEYPKRKLSLKEKFKNSFLQEKELQLNVQQATLEGYIRLGLTPLEARDVIDDLLYGKNKYKFEKSEKL